MSTSRRAMAQDFKMKSLMVILAGLSEPVRTLEMSSFNRARSYPSTNPSMNVPLRVHPHNSSDSRSNEEWSAWTRSNEC